jgi:hypothetical protein
MIVGNGAAGRGRGGFIAEMAALWVRNWETRCC